MDVLLCCQMGVVHAAPATAKSFVGVGVLFLLFRFLGCCCAQSRVSYEGGVQQLFHWHLNIGLGCLVRDWITLSSDVIGEDI